MLGKAWGIQGGRPKGKAWGMGEPGSAPQYAQKGLRRSGRWEPQVGYQLKAVQYIREQLKTKRLGKFTQEQGAEEWAEPADVEEQVWTEIRERGFRGTVRNRCLRRLWERRATIATEVERLELGRAGGVNRLHKRTSGAWRRACTGGGQRSLTAEVSEALAAHEGGEEGVEEKGGDVVKRRARKSALLDVLDQVKITFDNWRLGDQYVDSEDF